MNKKNKIIIAISSSVVLVTAGGYFLNQDLKNTELLENDTVIQVIPDIQNSGVLSDNELLVNSSNSSSDNTENQYQNTTNTPISPGTSANTIKPGTPIVPEDTTKPDIPETVITNLIITKKDLVDGVATISDASYETVTIEDSVGNGKIVLDNVKVKKDLILEDGVRYQIQVKNSTVPSLTVKTKDVLQARNQELTVNKNIQGPSIRLENVKELNNVMINGNASISGNSQIANLDVANVILYVDVPVTTMTIDKSSNYADITINQNVSEIINNGTSTILGVNANVETIHSNGNKNNIYVKSGVTLGNVTINGDFTKVMGNGEVKAIAVNGNNNGVYTNTAKENITINESSTNIFIGKEDKYEIKTITLNKQGVIEFTLNEKTSRPLTLSDISILCQGGNSMTIFSVKTEDNKTYILNTSYYKDNIYDLYITLPNGNVISKEFNYSYNYPMASTVLVNRVNPTEANLEVYGVDEGGYLYYQLVEKNNTRTSNVLTADQIKQNGIKVSMTTEYNEFLISSLAEAKEYDLYYVMEAYDGRTSSVYGPINIEKYEENTNNESYNLDYLAEVETNKFVFTFNKPVKGDLKLEDFTILCPQESALTTKGAKFIVSEDKKTYTIIVPDNYGHKDNKYTVSVNMPDGTVVTDSFRSHFNPPAITGEVLKYIAKDKLKLNFTSDEHGTLYYGIFESNNSAFADDSTTPMADDVLSGKIASTKVNLASGYNTVDIDLSNYTLTLNSRVWVLYVDYDNNYRNGFVDHYKIPQYVEIPEEDTEDTSTLDITKIVASEYYGRSYIDLYFTEDVMYRISQNNIKIQSLSGVEMPAKLLLSVGSIIDEPNRIEIEILNFKLPTGDYRITINMNDSNNKPVEIIKDFTVQ